MWPLVVLQAYIDIDISSSNFTFEDHLDNAAIQSCTYNHFVRRISSYTHTHTLTHKQTNRYNLSRWTRYWKCQRGRLSPSATSHTHFTQTNLSTSLHPSDVILQTIRLFSWRCYERKSISHSAQSRANFLGYAIDRMMDASIGGQILDLNRNEL